MMEQSLRVVDYSRIYIASLFDKDDAKDDFNEEEKLEEDDDPFDDDVSSIQSMSAASSSKGVSSDMLSMSIESDDEKPLSFWADFDLEQKAFCPKLALNLDAPLIILPNLATPTERFELDFGTISISSKLIKDKGRWLNFPEKSFLGMQVLV